MSFFLDIEINDSKINKDLPGIEEPFLDGFYFSDLLELDEEYSLQSKNTDFSNSNNIITEQPRQTRQTIQPRQTIQTRQTRKGDNNPPLIGANATKAN